MRRPLILTLILLFAMTKPGLVWSQTFVNSDVQTNTTWTLFQSPIIVTTDIVIDPGVTLEVEPGVEVRMHDQVVIKVQGILQALGSPGDSIRFRADSVLWGGIRLQFSAGSKVKMAYCDISESDFGIAAGGLSGNDLLELTHSRIHSTNSGLDAFPQQIFDIYACTFDDNFYGIYQSNLSFRECSFNRNSTAIFDSDIDLDSCNLSKSTITAIEGGSGSVKRSSFFYNTTALSGFGASATDSVVDCEIILNDTGVVVTSDLPKYFANQICGNGLGVLVATPNNVDMTGNCWCTTDSVVVADLVLEGNDLSGTGFLDFVPMDSCDYPGTVWPGDANDDGEANIADLLSIGVAFGAQGATRPNATQFWAAQTGVPWGLTFSDGTDYIHADCNGSGLVDLNDTLAILANFGQTHPKTSNIPVNGNAGLCLSYPETAMPGDTFMVNLFFGQGFIPPTGAYGFAITLGYDRSIIDSARITTDLTSSFIGNQGSEVVDLEVSNEKFHWAITRTNHTDTLFNGRMGGVEMIMIDDLARVIPINITVDDVVLIDSSGTRIAVNLENCGGDPPSPARFGVNTYPNPGGEMITIEWEEMEPQSIQLYDLSGQLKQSWEQPANQKIEWDTQNYPPGIYLIRVQVPNGFLTRKITISR